VIIITKRLKLKDPVDVQNLIKSWLRVVAETGKLPFEKDGGTIVQMLNVWLKSYEMNKLDEIERRLGALESEKK